jgi:predicted nucleotidyltransferase
LKTKVIDGYREQIINCEGKIKKVVDGVWGEQVKMTETIQRDLETITKAITANTQTVAIYLFGSYAYGQPHDDSDLDIYVVIPDTDVDTLELGGKIRFDLYKKITMPLDLLIGKQSVFNRRSKMLTLENIIEQQGVKLYGN